MRYFINKTNYLDFSTFAENRKTSEENTADRIRYAIELFGEEIGERWQRPNVKPFHRALA